MALTAIDSYFKGLEEPVGMSAGWVQWGVVRGTWLRHIYSSLMGLFFALVLYGPLGLVNFALTSTTGYLLLLTTPRRHIGACMFIFCFSYLSYVHICRLFTNWMGSQQDASTLQMVLTCKLISLAFNYQDGISKEVETEQAPYVLQTLPNAGEYFSYLTFYAGFVLGPVYEYADYVQFIREEGEFKEVPCPIRRSATQFLQGVLCICAFTPLLAHFPLSDLLDPSWTSNPAWYKFISYNAVMLGYKLQYYSCFRLCESGIIASGLGFNGFNPDKTPNWSRVRGINILKSEFGETLKVMIDNWNISVALWLRRYVFNRLAKKNAPAWRKSWALYMTMGLSAAWHGFYPGYFVFFCLLSLLSEVTKMVYKSGFMQIQGWWTLKCVAWLTMYFANNFHGVLYLLLGYREIINALNAVCWIPTLLLFTVWRLLKVTEVHRSKPKSQ